ncbi:lysosome-associated membrane glycoprotein 3-like [Sinocyclocheilus rhinocerous]|uniref:lysosome-associated membrane glycoprotein 3-like n=1 Tax=Sinocyclocheilus rhinocerous TaxID=307959 RepID=UPI0007BA2B28|nr:PREDICTED: lysosome-associated membrane glycoprotein 3-like [Sinocyclocheilus rhinocerous]
MNYTSRHIALLLLLSSMHWLGSSLATKPLHLSASADEVPAIINSDPPITNLSKRPVLQPKETTPPQFLCTLRNPQGKVCVRASLGVEYVVRENKKNYYFNMNPSSTQATGFCGNQKSILSLDFDGGHLEFTFIKEGDLSYVSTIKGLLRPAPPCKNCQNKTYVGVINHDKLFKAKNGLSFQCKSQMTLILASYFRVKLVPLQIQAFDLANGAFGKEVECWEDYNKRMIPIILGAVAAAVCLIAILTYVLVRERRGQGYEQL